VNVLPIWRLPILRDFLACRFGGQDVGITVHTVMGFRRLDETIQRRIIAMAFERVNAESSSRSATTQRPETSQTGQKERSQETEGIRILWRNRDLCWVRAIDELKRCRDEAQARVDNAYTDWTNATQSVIAFTSDALAVHTAIGHAGSRYYRIELHGNGISAYLRPPSYGEVFADGADTPEILDAASLTGDPQGQLDDGVPALHRDFRDCIREGREPLTSIHDVVHSMRLLEQVARLDALGQPLEDGA